MDSPASAGEALEWAAGDPHVHTTAWGCDIGRDPEEIVELLELFGLDVASSLVWGAGYERDRPGELLLLAFTQAIVPKTVLCVSLALGSLGVPLRHKIPFAIDTVRAYRRGRAACIPRSVPWDELLGVQIDEVRMRLGIASTAQTHSGRCWREDDATGTWRRVPVEGSVASA